VWDLQAALDANAHGVEPEAIEAPKKKSKKGSKVSSVGIAAGSVVQMRVAAATSAHDKDINAVAVAPNDMFVATGACVHLSACIHIACFSARQFNILAACSQACCFLDTSESIARDCMPP
jgi:hypothetical protein